MKMAQRTRTGYLFGGVCQPWRGRAVCRGGQWQPGRTWRGGRVFSGSFGVAFGAGVELVSRVTQGASPWAHAAHHRRRWQCGAGTGRPACPGRAAANAGCFLQDDPRSGVRRIRSTPAVLTNADSRCMVAGRTGHFGADTRVRHTGWMAPARVGLGRYGGAGHATGLCQRNAGAARADLVRICTEIREELAPRKLSRRRLAQLRGTVPVQRQRWRPGRQREVAGAIYVSCSGRGGRILRAGCRAADRAPRLGDVPLVGFFAAGEIARNQLYGYTGVLTVSAPRPIEAPGSVLLGGGPRQPIPAGRRAASTHSVALGGCQLGGLVGLPAFGSIAGKHHGFGRQFVQRTEVVGGRVEGHVLQALSM